MTSLSTDGLSTSRRLLLEWSDIPLRFILAATFITHGSGKLFGGIGEFAGHLEKMNVPAPTLMAALAAFAEFGGGVAMALGLFTRLAALGHMAVMAVAIATVHWSQGFAAHEGKGFEWQLALFCIAFTLLLRGAGPLSIDRILRGYWSRRRMIRIAEQKT